MNERSKKAVLAVTVITAFLTTFSSSSMELSIPNMEAQFGVSAAAIGFVLTAYLLTTAAMSVPFGKLADVKGRRGVFLVGTLGFCLASVFCTVAMNFPMLLAGRVMQGVFASMLFATNNAILISVYPDNMRGKMLGISISATYIGLSAGPVVGGLLNHYLSWRAIFAIAAVLGLVSFILGWKHTPRQKPMVQSDKADIRGNILFMAAIVVTLYGLNNLSIMKAGKWIFIGGLVLGVLFALSERNVKVPVVDLSMFKNKAFTFSNLAAFLNYGATYAISYLMSIYLQVVQGFDSQIAGIIMVSMPLIQAIFTPLMGGLSDRIAPYKLASAGMGICVLSLFGLSRVSVITPVPVVMLLLGCAGFSFALFSSPNTNAIMSEVSKRDYASAQAILATMRTSGQTMSMAVVTIIVGTILGTKALADAEPGELVTVMHLAFLTFVILCIAGIVFSLQRRKGKKES